MRLKRGKESILEKREQLSKKAESNMGKMRKYGGTRKRRRTKDEREEKKGGDAKGPSSEIK